VIALREEQSENALDAMRVNSEFVSNEIDESDVQFENIPNKEFEHDEAHPNADSLIDATCFVSSVHPPRLTVLSDMSSYVHVRLSL
jgi:hypothetical protein